MRSENGIIDIHCHILPGIDDGPATIEEAIETIKVAMSQGVRGFVVTPHYHPGRFVVEAQKTRDILEELRYECKKRNLLVELYEGQECYYYSGLIAELAEENALTMNHTRNVLLEFDPDVSYSMVKSAVRDLKCHGYGVILAHFERYACLSEKERLVELKNQNVKLQMNFDTISEKGSLFHRNPWRKLIEQGIVDYLGSDCHGMKFRPYQITKACEWIEKQVDDSIIIDMFSHNIQLITKKG